MDTRILVPAIFDVSFNEKLLDSHRHTACVTKDGFITGQYKSSHMDTRILVLAVFDVSFNEKLLDSQCDFGLLFAGMNFNISITHADVDVLSCTLSGACT